MTPVRLEAADGKLVTYATLPMPEEALAAAGALKWNDRTFRAWGSLRIGEATCPLYRERPADDGNDPISCIVVMDPKTPRPKP